jgi:RNA polymerase sigma-70 factor (ECF subfamily)
LPVAAGEGGDELENLPAITADPLDAAEHAALLSALQRAILELPMEQRECVTLIALEGLDYEEASRVLGVPVGTIKSRLFRARAKLAALLKDR